MADREFIGKYRIMQVLGRGGATTVYEAVSPTGEMVNLEHGLTRIANTEELTVHIRPLLKLAHPHLVPILDYGVEDGAAYLVTPHFEENLKLRIQRQPLNPAEAAYVLYEVGGALDYLHANAILHRDITSESIWFDTSGNIFLAGHDYLFKAFNSDNAGLTATGTVIGAPDYMAPEQISGNPVEQQTDIYMLGVTLFESLTDQFPFRQGSTMELLLAKARGAAPASVGDPTLDQVFARALAPNPEDRYASGAEFYAAFHAAITDQKAEEKTKKDEARRESQPGGGRGAPPSNMPATETPVSAVDDAPSDEQEKTPPYEPQTGEDIDSFDDLFVSDGLVPEIVAEVDSPAVDFSDMFDDLEADVPPPSKPEFSLGGESTPILDTVAFTAYYPHEPEPDVHYPLYIYAHLAGAMTRVESDIAQFKASFGGTIPAPSTSENTSLLARGTLLTVAIECEHILFDPIAITKKWEGDLLRFDFGFKFAARFNTEQIRGRVTISVNGFEIAHIDLLMVPQLHPDRTANPLAAAKFMGSTPVRPYRRIFISYSRHDKAIAEAYRLAQMAIGDDVFMDTYSIRSGENWQAALAKAIDDADIFQLFWSEHSAISSNVHDEWDYALNYRCASTRCENFIRPVYWETPMRVAPPSELSHLNFRYVPFGSS
jgi:serine/threonine-protein kinase